MRTRIILGVAALVVAAVPLVGQAPASAETRYGQANRPGTTHIASLFQYHNKQGDRLWITAAGGCDSETSGEPDYYVTNLGASPYLSNNGTSSFTDFASCDTKLFNGTNGTGTSFGYYNGGEGAGMNITGSFDNTASSVQWD